MLGISAKRIPIEQTIKKIGGMQVLFKLFLTDK